jgi:hypothetical protein
MEFEIFDESKKGRFVLKASDHYSTEDHIEIIKQLVHHPHWRKGLDVLVDLQHESLENALVTDMIQISGIVAIIDKEYGVRRCAIVVPLCGFSKAALYKYQVDPKVDMATRV